MPMPSSRPNHSVTPSTSQPKKTQAFNFKQEDIMASQNQQPPSTIGDEASIDNLYDQEATDRVEDLN